MKADVRGGEHKGKNIVFNVGVLQMEGAGNIKVGCFWCWNRRTIGVLG